MSFSQTDARLLSLIARIQPSPLQPHSRELQELADIVRDLNHQLAQHAQQPASLPPALSAIDRPTSPGFWWLNDENAYGWEVVRVKPSPRDPRRLVCELPGCHNCVSIPKGQWIGPLQPPTQPDDTVTDTHNHSETAVLRKALRRCTQLLWRLKPVLGRLDKTWALEIENLQAQLPEEL